MVQSILEVVQFLLYQLHILGVLFHRRAHRLTRPSYHPLNLPERQPLQFIYDIVQVIYPTVMRLHLLIEVEDLLDDFGVQLRVAQDLLHRVYQVLGLLPNRQVG